jgi:transposase InsO family protein
MQSVRLKASTSRKADCYDNAPMESFFQPRPLRPSLAQQRPVLGVKGCN